MGRFAVQEGGHRACRWIAGNAGALPGCQAVPRLKRVNVVALLIDLVDQKATCLKKANVSIY